MVLCATVHTFCNGASGMGAVGDAMVLSASREDVAYRKKVQRNPGKKTIARSDMMGNTFLQ